MNNKDNFPDYSKANYYALLKILKNNEFMGDDALYEDEIEFIEKELDKREQKGFQFAVSFHSINNDTYENVACLIGLY